MTGPATDNLAGTRIIEEQLGVPAFNALTTAQRWRTLVSEAGSAFLWPRRWDERASPAVVLGGTGYVAGELLRLLAGHPRFALAAVLSDSQRRRRARRPPSRTSRACYPRRWRSRGARI